MCLSTNEWVMKCDLFAQWNISQLLRKRDEIMKFTDRLIEINE